MIETHAHIYDESFDEDRALIVSRAKELGIQEIWMPNCSSETLKALYASEEQFPDACRPMMGLHPAYVNETYVEELKTAAAELEKREFIMIGEIGLDFYWDLTFVKEQEEAFMTQLEWAKKYNLPICIHSRNSKDNSWNAILRCCELIEEFNWPQLRGIFHCFSGNLEEAQRVIGLNFLLGIGGVATFKNGGIDKWLGEIDLKHLVLETDAPYLAPVPFRGKRNEPSYLQLVVKKLSEIYACSEDIIKAQTTENAKKLINEL
ncbi:TatD-related deoxyribonuclease [Leadbetterella byssophila DSM 17132]|uniref:TatD-related deoxyribonuclease n=1 Tax=Leadbetterella byssophila (strain DSM 17132 / JCM 16389 / KACC 11308 / NBRC 106382 / 4M15) TaxID=649349 RepID=E4RWR6_LEAB4|nr:TatD family hydrolase [Leadbetterella byssophila]ADQ16235.1 TatD-related deoxyribonuclease [Leadbetterella byssophila DSM 17132]